MSADNKKNMKLLGASYIVLLGGLSLAAFLWVTVLDSFFWVSYLFTVLASAGVFAAAEYYLSDEEKAIREFPANAITGVFACGYMIVELAIVIWFGILYKMELPYYLAVHMIGLTLVGAAFLVSSIGKKSINKMEDETKEKVRNLQMHCAEINSIHELSAGVHNEIKNKVNQKIDEVYEAIRFSDPMVDESLTEWDEKMQKGIAELSLEVQQLAKEKSTEMGRLNSIVDKLKGIIQNRNIQIKLAK